MFEEFIELLRYHGFNIGIDTHLKISRLIQGVQGELTGERLKTLLAPILVQNEQQQEEFYQLFDQYFSQYQSNTSFETSTEYVSPTVEEKPTKISNWLKILSQRRFYLLIQGILLLGLGYLGVELINCYTKTRSVEGTFLCMQGISVVDPLTEEPESSLSSPNEPLPPLPEAGLPTDPSSWDRLSEQLDLKKSPPLEEDISDLEANWYEQYNPLIKILIFVLLLVGWIFFEIYRHNRKKLLLLRERSKQGPYIWTVQPPESDQRLYTEEEFYLASRKLREREYGLGEEVDVQKSVEETTESGGYPSIAYKKRTKPPEYLVLIQQVHKKDHLAMFFQQMILELRQQDIFAECYFFDQDPRLCWQEKYGDSVYLEDLFRRYPEDRLIVIGDASIFFDPVKDDLCGWIHILHKWKQVALISPISPLEWGHREIRLSKEFILLPSTTEALGAVVEILNQDVNPPLRYWLETNEYPIPPPADEPDLVARLQEYFDTTYIEGKRDYKLGQGNLLFRWLCTCALYPELSWDLTLAMGRMLEQAEDQPVTIPNHVLKLTRLSWFRTGEMPDDLRESLIEQLSKKDEVMARKVIVEMLKNNPPPPGSYAEAEHELLLAVQKAQLHQDLGHNIQAIRQAQTFSLNHEIKEYTVVRYLKSIPRSIFKVGLPNRLNTWMFRQGISSLGLKRSFSGLLMVVVGGLILMSVNGAWMKIETFEDKRYYLADDQARMRYYTFVGNTHLDKQEFPQAARSYEEALLLRESSDAEGYLTPEYNLALLKWGLGKDQEAQAEFAKITEQSEELIADSSVPEVQKKQLNQIKTEAAYNQGVIAFRSQNLEEAEEAFQRVARMDLAHSDAVYGQALILLRKALRTQGADQTNKLVLALNRLQDVQKQDSSYLRTHQELGPVLDSLSMAAFPNQIESRLQELRLNLGLISEISPIQPDVATDTSLELDPKLEYLTDFQEGLAVVKYAGKYGFADVKSNLLGDRYEDAKPFSGGFAAVKRKGKWGYIDRNMQEVITAQYENADEFVQGWASAKQKGKWGMIDENNRIQIPFAYEQPIRFEDSSAVPPGYSRMAVAVQAGKYFFIDEEGKDVFIGERFKWAENFSVVSESYARVSRWNAKYYIDRSGDCVAKLLKDQRCPSPKWDRILVRDLHTHEGQINAINLSADNSYLISAGMDGQAILWKNMGKEEVVTLPHDRPLRAAVISSDNQMILTAGDDKRVRSWTPSGDLLQVFPAVSKRIWSLDMSPDNRLAVAGSEDEIAYLYTIKTGELRTRLVGHTQDVTCLSFSPNGTEIATGSEDGTVRFWNLEGKEIRRISVRSQVLSLAYSSDGKGLVVGSKAGLVISYDLTSSTTIPSLTLDQHKDWVWQVGFSPDGSYILSCSADQTAKVSNLKKQVVLDIKRPGTVRAARFSTDGKYIIIASWGESGSGNNKMSIYKVDQY